MTDHDPNEFTAIGTDLPNDRRDNGGNREADQSLDRPYGDAGNLYEIPRIRPEDPPMRRWWIDDETQQDGVSSQR